MLNNKAAVTSTRNIEYDDSMPPVITSMQAPAANTTASPSVAAVTIEFPPHRHSQEVAIATLTDWAGPQFHRFAASSGVQARNLALPLSRYTELTASLTRTTPSSESLWI